MWQRLCVCPRRALAWLSKPSSAAAPACAFVTVSVVNLVPPAGMGWVSSVHHGLDRAVDYPLANHSDPTLKGCRSPCNTSAANRSFAKIDGATCLPPEDYSKVAGSNETQMLAWLQHGPLSVSVAAGPFNGYRGGYIMNGSTCNTTAVDHAVLLVAHGHDSASGMDYWTIKVGASC